MSKVIIVCGKICSGKSYYSNEIKDSLNAVIISPDEATYELINNEQGEFYNVFSERLNKYLTKKVGEIVKAGANVIFERGLWSKKDRKQIREYYNSISPLARLLDWLSYKYRILFVEDFQPLELDDNQIVCLK